MLGEAADAVPSGSIGGPQLDQTMNTYRRKFNPAFQGPPGGPPQIIMPPGMPTRGPVQLQMIGVPAPQPAPPPPAPPPVVAPAPENPPAEDPAPEDPPDAP
jgi:hypothetical protein